MDKKKLTLCVPCWKRPQRTIRALECLLSQDFNGWEAYFVGDGCHEFSNMCDTKIFDKYIEQAKANGNELFVENLEHHGGWGYNVRNYIFKKANSEYLLFLDNDDVIKPNHFSNYYNSIAGTDNDFVYLNTWIEPLGIQRNAELKFGLIGHHEIIIKTDFLKTMPPQLSHYGHDWTLIENMMKNTNKYQKINNKDFTYIVKCLGDYRNDTID
jgi:glycosyltransferase involved in cell wall biosynthesis